MGNFTKCENVKYWNRSVFHGTYFGHRCFTEKSEMSAMQEQSLQDQTSAAIQLRPVVLIVVALKLMVFALLMTTIHIPAPTSMPLEIASVQ
ncbi:hypothetical protein P6U16_18685 [Rhizobium sp. 32-5/1]|uniref:hypothetical protein n=1 Tax=Rhizobium sp. 32-5/1 TaxID=3019602 RepID=UPI00240D422D|nr:hypothetical protein [Rhizobium sp. 32-5/1]WEZ82954.1 hypothetical protein P6U16_18685 [Rhizobium sp. 32-5/1]